MTQAKDSNGHGDGEYKIEYEHVTEDVWYEVDPQTGNRVDVAYTSEILDQMEEDDDEDDESSDE